MKPLCKLKTIILFSILLISGFTYGDQVAPLPYLNKIQAGDKPVSGITPTSDISQEIQKYRKENKARLLNSGNSYVEPYGALKGKGEDLKNTSQITAEGKTQTKLSKGVSLSAFILKTYQSSYKDYSDQYRKMMKSNKKLKIEAAPAVTIAPEVSNKKTKKNNNSGQRISQENSSSTALMTNNTKRVRKKKMEFLRTIKSTKKILPGDTYFALIQNKVNSDYPGPVQAKIINGNLNGATLLGKFERIDDKVRIIFSQMVLNKELYSINAIARNSKTYLTAIASDVNHHYFTRYASLFASSFLEGYGKAVSNSGQTSLSSFGSTTTYNNLNPMEKVMVGLGAVGQNLGSAAEKNFQRPPTVTVNADAGIGITFMTTVNLKSKTIGLNEPEWKKAMENNDE